jgi:hypothetical protein
LGKWEKRLGVQSSGLHPLLSGDKTPHLQDFLDFDLIRVGLHSFVSPAVFEKLLFEVLRRRFNKRKSMFRIPKRKFDFLKSSFSRVKSNVKSLKSDFSGLKS